MIFNISNNSTFSFFSYNLLASLIGTVMAIIIGLLGPLQYCII